MTLSNPYLINLITKGDSVIKSIPDPIKGELYKYEDFWWTWNGVTAELTDGRKCFWFVRRRHQIDRNDVDVMNNFSEEELTDEETEPQLITPSQWEEIYETTQQYFKDLERSSPVNRPGIEPNRMRNQTPPRIP